MMLYTSTVTLMAGSCPSGHQIAKGVQAEISIEAIDARAYLLVKQMPTTPDPQMHTCAVLKTTELNFTRLSPHASKDDTYTVARTVKGELQQENASASHDRMTEQGRLEAGSSVQVADLNPVHQPRRALVGSSVSKTKQNSMAQSIPHVL